MRHDFTILDIFNALSNGEIESGWTLKDEMLTMKVVIPANTSASIHIPGDPGAVQINGSGLLDSGIDYKKLEGETVLTAGSGSYVIVTTLK